MRASPLRPARTFFQGKTDGLSESNTHGSQDLLADIGICNQPAFIDQLNNCNIGMDIGLFDNRLFKTFKWFMGNQSKSVGIVDQRISCNSGNFMISLTETAINNDDF